ncbi:hypothetical protein SO802_028266 [Lithocarpus litseifolius]|uniref:CCHC-type domain-containing protein n=1 Tax=Lithocarpus litseifolius TaxID=425828 RepID=A0AAW2BS24_9ROSI
MVANNYLDEGRPHKVVIELIALGFTGKLLKWWNNCLTEESKEEIKQAVQKDEEGLPIFDEHLGRGIPDGVNTLIYTTIKHFVGKPSNITSRIYDQLRNPRCRTLGDYRWYEDVFTTRVLYRSDCNSPFWKEKFINGLPKLFREKANKSKAKYEVGNFCTQYDLPPIAPSKRKSKLRGKESPEISHRRKTASRYYRKQQFNEDDFCKKGKPSRSKSTGKYEKPTKVSGKCFKCGKKGLFSKECRSKAKSLINTLVSDQTSKDEIFKLLELDHIENLEKIHDRFSKSKEEEPSFQNLPEEPKSTSTLKKISVNNPTYSTSQTKNPELRTRGKLLYRTILKTKGSQNSRLKCMKDILSKEDNEGVYTDSLYSTKTILNILHSVYMIENNGLFQRTLKTLEILLVNVEARNEAITSHITSLLSGKEEVHSKDKTVLMGTDYARLSLKTQVSLRSAVANSPTEIQVSILGSKVMFEYIDQWFKHFKVLVTTPYPDPTELDDIEDIFAQLRWEECFGTSLRVNEKEHPFPSLLINYEDGPNEEDEMGPHWLSTMFEYGFVKAIKLTNHNQVSQFPQII